MKRHLAFLVFLSLFVPIGLFAAEGLVIEPAIQKIYLTAAGAPKEEIQTVTIKNTTSLELTFILRAIEFTNIDKNGGNIFLGQSLSEGDFKEANWVSLPETSILLIPGEEKNVPFQLRNTEALLPGAHYGAILFETIRPDSDSLTDPSKVYLRQIASSLLYVNKESGEDQRIAVRQVQRYHTFPKLIDSIVVTFANEGNAFVEPRGFVEVKNPFGWAQGKSILNETGKTLFPGQERQIEAKFEKVKYFFPGPYTFDISYRINDGEYQKTSLTVWYWEPIILVIIALIFGGVIWLAFHPRFSLFRRLKK